ncbi:hypothetical protein FH972_024717 [Carpinus fangiana]|uniref:Poly A polymerase head domain-containing protein n=1 Tax=Carpinus fangiana TaxID=176857 RepID=A0A5N6KYT6_9ROSI|nr:hypothetical protein FH972_024717 [Carpinus fangiana]
MITSHSAKLSRCFLDLSAGQVSARRSQLSFQSLRTSYCHVIPSLFVSRIHTTRPRQIKMDSFSEPTIKLNEGEERLQTMLLDAAKIINPSSPPELRFAGGWVRDKLLGSQSHDVDIAIEDMTGETFGLAMKDYLEQPGVLDKYGMGNEIVKGLHKIAANPEKSKQLETATTKVFGLDLDLVNLRKETYSEDSRNPVMEFGTPEEDALRRDATINAMFYNLQTKKVEDWTHLGMSDLRGKIIRTPLQPYQTFKDDPLRVLRLIRFASRLHFTIDPKAVDAMKDISIKDALKAKISRERVGIEIEKMLRGNDPHLALKMINDYGLYSTIFVDPASTNSFSPHTEDWHLMYDCLRDILADNDAAEDAALLPDSEHKYLAWVLAAHIPWLDAPQPKEQSQKRPPPPVAVVVAREGIKATNKVCDVLNASLLNLDHIIDLKNTCVKQTKPNNILRGTLGMAIRKWGASWRSQVVFALLVESKKGGAKETIQQYRKFMKTVKQMSLLGAHNLKPVLDGKRLAKELNTKPGPWMKDAMDAAMLWQLENPHQATVEGAIEAIKNGELAERLAKGFLQLTIRPLFSKTNNPDLTPQGHMRIAESSRSVQAKRFDTIETEEQWKHESNTVIGLLTWCLRVLKPSQIQTLWGQLIPPILKMVDDSEVVYKVAGLELLGHLLTGINPEQLRYTGTGPLFEAAIKPALSYLPSLTPEHESVQVLHAAFGTWSILTQRRWPDQPTLANSSTGSSDPTQLQTRASPEYIQYVKVQMLRQYVAPSLRHVEANYPKVASVLLKQLQTTFRLAGSTLIEDKDVILPLLVEYLQDPMVAKTCPDLLVQVARTTKAFITCAWPMIWLWRGDIYGALSEAWVNTCNELAEGNAVDEKKQSLLVAQEDLRDCSATMLEALSKGSDADDQISDEKIKEELLMLVEAEPLCRGLFPDSI